MSTFSRIGQDLPNISAILTVNGNLTQEDLDIKRNQLSIKFSLGEINKPQYEQYLQQLQNLPIYSGDSIIPQNLPTVISSPENLTNDIIRNLVTIKPRLVRGTDVINTGQFMNLVSINTLQIQTELYTKSFSPKLINWVEPYDVSGFLKTLFYTEVNSELKVGDRVFIINGNYDSDLLIKSDKYKRGRDGYKILEIDRCKIILDIDYNGELPYIDEELDNFIKVHYIRDRTEFLQINREITTRGGTVSNRFNYYQNNIAYIDSTYLPNSSGWGDHTGIFSPGFYVRDSSTYPAVWQDITTSFLSGSFSFALSPNYYNNNRIKILNGDFQYAGRTYQEGFVYKFDVGPTQSVWEVDSRYNIPFITKANFRDGSFKGLWNTGLFGRQDKRIIWDGDGSRWQIGTLLNAYWTKGTFNSKYSSLNSFYADIDEYGLAYQKANLPDNNGRGYNFIIDSFIESSTIINGTIINTIFGSQSATFSVVENHLLSATTSYNNIVRKGYFQDSKFNNTSITGAEINNGRSFNSRFGNIKSINSKFKESVIKDSNYISDKIIKIQAYDEWTASEFQPYTNGASNKMYKFYINKKGFERLRNKDFFYIKGLKINNNSKDVLNFFDKKFVLSSSTQYTDELSTLTNLFYKRGVEYVCYLSSPLDNQYKITSVGTTTSSITQAVEVNENATYSVDIFIKTSDIVGLSLDNINFNRDLAISATISITMSTSLGNIIDISEAYIVDSDFDSGIVETSNWNFGDNINFNNDVNMTIPSSSGGFYNIALVSTSSNVLSVTTTYNYNYAEADDTNLNLNDVVFLNSVWYNTENYVTDLIIGTEGTGYFTASGVTVSGITSSGQGLSLDISANGTVSSVTINQPGLYYSVGDVLTIQSGNVDATVIITGVTSSMNLLPTDYIITSSDGLGNLELKEIINPGSSSIFSQLKLGGSFSSPNAQNRYGYIHRSKFHKSKIKSGIFRRSLFSNSLIENDEYQSSDKDYTNLPMIRNLVVTDSIFENNLNILSNATYLYSHFINGNNIWTNGIVQNSIWNGLTFSNGVIKQSRWINGTFNSGLFYESRTFDANPSTDERFYYVENIKSYYKDGSTTATISNDRHSWQNGTFRLGIRNRNSEFYKSDWEGGTFENGKFYYSKWYDGHLKGGVFGDSSIDVSDTMFYNGTVSYKIVENASFYAFDTSYQQSTQNNINWYNGIFNDGIFGTEWQQYTASNTATWYTGEFNGGQFISLAKWKNGTFNNGKFISGFGWTYSTSNSILDYGWENGLFNNGEFGNAELGTNSTWWNGQFDGGLFKGRVWNFGIFKGGDFQGSSTISSVGGVASSNAKSFVDSFRSEFYGLWRDGFFTDQKDKLIKDTKLFTQVERFEQSSLRKPYKATKISNSLWLNGTFSHQSGESTNVVWLNGTFDKGKFLSGAFNPYVRRNPDSKNVWQSNYLPEFINNGSFTSSLGGWATATGFDGISAYSTFSISTNQAFYISDFDAPSLYLTSSTNLVEGEYLIEFDLVTFSSPFNNLYLSFKTGNTTTDILSQISDQNIGNNKQLKTLGDGTFSIYVDTDGQGGSLVIDNLSIKLSPTASFNYDDSCIWKDGFLDNSDFYISKWEKGNLMVATGWGMIWKNGISNYMNAINIFWEDGLWRNGNWYGSSFEFDGEVDDDFTKQILFRGMSWSGTSSLHIWNVFESVLESNISYSSTASSQYLDTSIDAVVFSPPSPPPPSPPVPPIPSPPAPLPPVGPPPPL